MRSKILKVLAYLGASITIAILSFIVIYIIIKGVPYLTPSLFALEYNSENVSMFPASITTLLMIIFSLLLALPLGIGTAIYLVEYATKNNKLVPAIRLATETLAGIPSIIFGLFGRIFFVITLGLSFSFISGVLTLTIMILPLIIRSSEEALLAVNDSLREGSFGLGAGKLRTSYKIVLPSASAGILSGVILAIGRIVGESAALIFTAGAVAQIPGMSETGSLFSDSARTLAVHMYYLSTEGLHINESYATAFILLIIVVVINIFANFIQKKAALKTR